MGKRYIDADRFERDLLSMGEDNICNECCMSVIEALDAQPTFEGIPSAQPEQKKGRWIETDDGWDSIYYVCSECGCPRTLIDGTPEDNGMHYCPNCGADMRGDTDG